MTVYSGLKCHTVKVINRFHQANELFDGTLNQLHVSAYATALADNECYTYRDAMKQPDRADFVRAMVKEVDDHETREHRKMMLRSDMPEGAKTIMAIWSFKR